MLCSVTGTLPTHVFIIHSILWALSSSILSSYRVAVVLYVHTHTPRALVPDQPHDQSVLINQPFISWLPKFHASSLFKISSHNNHYVQDLPSSAFTGKLGIKLVYSLECREASPSCKFSDRRIVARYWGIQNGLNLQYRTYTVRDNNSALAIMYYALKQ